MNFLELVQMRQSDRAFDGSREVEQEKLDYICECARLAPSACNAQPWRIIVVDDPVLKNRVADCTSSKVLGMNHFTKQAPVHLLLIEEGANFTSSFGSWAKKKHFPHIDMGIMAEHITLAAAEQGLGSCIVGWFDEAAVKQLLGIPRSKRVVLDIVLGYSMQVTRSKQRKEMKEMVSKNKY